MLPLRGLFLLNLIPSVLQRGTRTPSTLCVRVRVVTCSTPGVKHGEQVAQDKQVTGGGRGVDGRSLTPHSSIQGDTAFVNSDSNTPTDLAAQ